MSTSRIHDITTGQEHLPAWRVPARDLAAFKALAREIGFSGVYVLHTSEVVTASWVGLKCRYGCAQYNTNWCCPPAAPSLEKTQALLSEYELALLLVGEKTNQDFYRNRSHKRREQVRQWKMTVLLERRLFLRGYYKAFGLPGETCALCEECAYPANCRFPNEKRPAVEACSIDVLQTVERLGTRVRVARDVRESYNSYSLILLE